MLIFVFLVTDEHEVYFTTWFTGRIRFLFIYYTVSPYNRTKEISKNGKCFPCFFRKNVSKAFLRRRHFRGGHFAIEGRRKVHFSLSPSSAFLKFLSFFLKVFRRHRLFVFPRTGALLRLVAGLFRSRPRLRRAQSANGLASCKFLCEKIIHRPLPLGFMPNYGRSAFFASGLTTPISGAYPCQPTA